MRALTLDQKISIKGDLARKGIVLPQILARINMKEALSLYWRVTGRPLSAHSSPSSKQWRKSPRRIIRAASTFGLPV